MTIIDEILPLLIIGKSAMYVPWLNWQNMVQSVLSVRICHGCMDQWDLSVCICNGWIDQSDLSVCICYGWIDQSDLSVFIWFFESVN